MLKWSNNFGNSYNCLNFNELISLYNIALKLKKLFSTRKAIFQNPFQLCCVTFCLLGKILLVSRIQTAFARRKRRGYARLGNIDVHSPVRASKSSFGLVACLYRFEVVVIDERTSWCLCRTRTNVEAARFHISFILSHEKRRSLISIVTSVSFIRWIDSTAKEVFERRPFPGDLQQASYHMAPRALS